jgi:mRNA interferase MazF
LNRIFNNATGLAIVCPITNTNRKIPFHLPIANLSNLTGFVMIEQIKSVDFKSRNVKFIEKAPDDLLNDINEIINICIE